MNYTQNFSNNASGRYGEILCTGTEKDQSPEQSKVFAPYAQLSKRISSQSGDVMTKSFILEIAVAGALTFVVHVVE